MIHESSLYSYKQDFLILSPFGGGSLKGGGGGRQLLGYTIFLTLSTLPLRVLPPCLPQAGKGRQKYKLKNSIHPPHPCLPQAGKGGQLLSNLLLLV